MSATVVDLPLVPVTPTIRSRLAGRPKHPPPPPARAPPPAAPPPHPPPTGGPAKPRPRRSRRGHPRAPPPHGRDSVAARSSHQQRRRAPADGVVQVVVPIATAADHGTEQRPGDHPPGVVRDALERRERLGGVEQLTPLLQRRNHFAQRGHRPPGAAATSVTTVPAAALVPGAGAIAATSPHPRTRTWKPLWCSAAAAARRRRPGASGTRRPGPG